MQFINYLCKMKVREVIAYKRYFIDFMSSLPQKMQDKVAKSITYIETVHNVPSTYLKHIEGTKGLFELRARLSKDTVRVFCFFDEGRLVVLLSGFVKKTQKTPKEEIEKALRLMEEYYIEKTAGK